MEISSFNYDQWKNNTLCGDITCACYINPWIHALPLKLGQSNHYVEEDSNQPIENFHFEYPSRKSRRMNVIELPLK